MRYGAPSLLLNLRPRLAAAAQEVVDQWEQDDNGVSEDYGTGGVCDDVAEAMCDVLREAGVGDCRTFHHFDDNHTVVLAVVSVCVWEVDISPSVYEIGSWYNYRKRDGVRISASDVSVTMTEYDPTRLDEMEE